MMKRLRPGLLSLLILLDLARWNDGSQLEAFLRVPAPTFLNPGRTTCNYAKMSVTGASSKRGGRLPVVNPEKLESVIPLPLFQERYLLVSRTSSWQEAWHLELSVAGASEVEEGLWKTSQPLAREQLALLTCVRAELVSLSGPLGISSAIKLGDVIANTKLRADRWGLHHERLVSPDRFQHDQAASTDVRALVAHGIEGRANFSRPDVLFVILEGSGGYRWGAATWTRGKQTEDRFAAWSRRKFTFSSSLDPMLAALACNIAQVRAGDTLLDPCCGSGTILFAALERGAVARGLDVRPSFVARCRDNLEGMGYASRGGGWLRGLGCHQEKLQCAVGTHDLRDDMADLVALQAPDAVVANLPHNNNFKTPYAGYVGNMLESLAQGLRARGCAARGTRIVFITEGEGDKKNHAGDAATLQLLQGLGFQVLGTAVIKNGLQRITLASLLTE